MILVVFLSPSSQIPGHKKHLKLGLSYCFFPNLYNSSYTNHPTIHYYILSY